METLSNVWFWFTEDVWFLLTLIAVPVVTYIFVDILLKMKLPELAKKGYLFAIPEKDEIILLEKGGRQIGYFGNLYARNKSVILETGLVVDGTINDPLKNSRWWKKYGVICMGFGGKVAYRIPYINTTEVLIDDAETNDVVALKIPLTVTTNVTDARKCMGIDWKEILSTKIEDVGGGVVSTNSYHLVASEVYKKDGKLFAGIFGLNDELKELMGQEVSKGGFSVSKIIITDENVRQALLAKEVADGERAGKVSEAEGKAEVAKLEADSDLALAKIEAQKRLVEITQEAEGKYIIAEKEADGIIVIGIAENETLSVRKNILGQKGAAELEKAKAFSLGLEKFNGSTLVLGANASVITGVDNLTSAKPEKKEKK